MRRAKRDRSGRSPLVRERLEPPRQDANQTEVTMPAGMLASRVDLAGETYVVLCYPAAEWTMPDALTAAEREVALAVVGGSTNQEIASMRGSSARTVAHQVASIYAKVGVSSRAEFASKLGAFARKRPS